MNGKYQLTESGFQKLQEELEYMKNTERIEIIEQLKEARAQGDLSENADYDSARDRQAQIEAKIKEIESILKNSEIITDSVLTNLGKFVTIRFEDDQSKDTFKIVGSLEADPLKGFISYESPLGHAILHRKVGESAYVRPENNAPEFTVTIISISD